MLRGLLSRIEKIESHTEAVKNAKYRFERDAYGNLRIIFANDKLFQLPVFEFRPYQLIIQEELFIHRRKYFYLWWPRRHGKEVVSWNMIIQGALTEPGLYIMIYPTNVRARMVLWDGSITFPDGSAFAFRDMLPKNFILGKPNHQEMTIKLINGSVIRILGSDTDPDKLRGTNPRGVVISEFAFCDPRVLMVLLPIMRQNNGWVMMQSTPSGMNHATKKMRELQSNDEWYTRIENVTTLVDANGNRYVTDEMLDKERRSGMPEWMVQQEYFCNVESNTEIFYFSKEMNYILSPDFDRIRDGVWVPGKTVYTAFDIGMNDSTGMTLFQMRGHEPHVIFYYESNNQSLAHYKNVAEEFVNKRNLTIKTYFTPHDGVNRSWGSGKTANDYGREMGMNMRSVARPSSHFNAIQSIRKLLPACVFERSTTERLIDCLSNYQKEFDEKNNIYEDKPLHNWASHGVKSFQTMALAIEANMVHEQMTGLIYYNQNII